MSRTFKTEEPMQEENNNGSVHINEIWYGVYT